MLSTLVLWRVAINNYLIIYCIPHCTSASHVVVTAHDQVYLQACFNQTYSFATYEPGCSDMLQQVHC